MKSEKNIMYVDLSGVIMIQHTNRQKNHKKAFIIDTIGGILPRIRQPHTGFSIDIDTMLLTADVYTKKNMEGTSRHFHKMYYLLDDFSEKCRCGINIMIRGILEPTQYIHIPSVIIDILYYDISDFPYLWNKRGMENIECVHFYSFMIKCPKGSFGVGYVSPDEFRGHIAERLDEVLTEFYIST